MTILVCSEVNVALLYVAIQNTQANCKVVEGKLNEKNE